MSNIVRIGLAAALVVASASVALAQTYEQPEPARASEGYSGRQLSSSARPNVGQSVPYNEYDDTSPDQSWNVLLDPAEADGG